MTFVIRCMTHDFPLVAESDPSDRTEIEFLLINKQTDHMITPCGQEVTHSSRFLHFGHKLVFYLRQTQKSAVTLEDSFNIVNTRT